MTMSLSNVGSTSGLLKPPDNARLSGFMSCPAEDDRRPSRDTPPAQRGGGVLVCSALLCRGGVRGLIRASDTDRIRVNPTVLVITSRLFRNRFWIHTGCLEKKFTREILNKIRNFVCTHFIFA